MDRDLQPRSDLPQILPILPISICIERIFFYRGGTAVKSFSHALLVLIFNNASRNFPAQRGRLSRIWCKILAQYRVMQSVTAVRSVLVEGKESRVWFVCYSAANCFANCTISYSRHLWQEQNQAISAEVSSQYEAFTKSPESSVCWFLTFPNQSCCMQTLVWCLRVWPVNIT